MIGVRKKEIRKGKYIFNKFLVPYIIQDQIISNPDIVILCFSLLGSIRCGGKYLSLFCCLDDLDVQ